MNFPIREVLYRGKRVDKGGWVYGGIVHQTDWYGYPVDKWYIIDGTSTEDNDIGYAYEVYDYSVGLYTGITDCAGKRIFEDDLVKVCDCRLTWEPMRVVWHRGYLRFCFATVKEAYEPMLSNNSCLYTVVGNVFDNPELWVKAGAR